LFFGSVAPARELEIHRVSLRVRAPHEAEALRDRPINTPQSCCAGEHCADILSIRTASGASRDIYFDIEDFPRDVK
jgi:hypothetical protein